jgi:hypothetical protein
VITWGRYYWPFFLLAVTVAFAIPEIYAIITNVSNTLSDYSWQELHVGRIWPVHTIAWYCSLAVWGLFVVVITAHIWWRW